MMKPFYTLAVCFLTTLQIGLFAQDIITYEAAEITTDYCVSLDTTKPVSEFYEMDIGHLSLASQIEASNRFGFISNNLLSYTVDFDHSKAYLQVHLDRTSEPHDVFWWNEYIDSLCGL